MTKPGTWEVVPGFVVWGWDSQIWKGQPTTFFSRGFA